MGLGLVQPFAQRGRGDAVAQEGGQRSRGEGHHRALADELLDVVEGGVGEVARCGARPLGAQRLAASRCQLVPGRATEQLPVAGGEPSRQGHGRLAAQVGPPQRLQAGINGGVERGQRKGGHGRWRGAPDAVAGDVLLQPGQVSGGGLLIVSDREKVCDVNRYAVGHQFAHGVDADGRGRNLDHDVVAVDVVGHVAHLGHGCRHAVE